MPNHQFSCNIRAKRAPAGAGSEMPIFACPRSDMHTEMRTANETRVRSSVWLQKGVYGSMIAFNCVKRFRSRCLAIAQFIQRRLPNFVFENIVQA